MYRIVCRLNLETATQTNKKTTLLHVWSNCHPGKPKAARRSKINTFQCTLQPLQQRCSIIATNVVFVLCQSHLNGHANRDAGLTNRELQRVTALLNSCTCGRLPCGGGNLSVAMLVLIEVTVSVRNARLCKPQSIVLERKKLRQQKHFRSKKLISASGREEPLFPIQARIFAERIFYLSTYPVLSCPVLSYPILSIYVQSIYIIYIYVTMLIYVWISGAY